MSNSPESEIRLRQVVATLTYFVRRLVKWMGKWWWRREVVQIWSWFAGGLKVVAVLIMHVEFHCRKSQSSNNSLIIGGTENSMAL